MEHTTSKISMYYSRGSFSREIILIRIDFKMSWSLNPPISFGFDSMTIYSRSVMLEIHDFSLKPFFRRTPRGSFKMLIE